MVLQNANNQLFSPFPKLIPVNFPDGAAKTTPVLFCKTLKNIDCLFFEGKNGLFLGHEGKTRI
jgi:hypothetical protein